MDLEQPERKVWKVPELAERLLLFLDPSTTLHLAQAQVMNKDIFRQSLSFKVWMNLVKQSEANRKDVRSLVAILKRIQPEMFTVDPVGLTAPTPTQEDPIVDQKFGETEMPQEEGEVMVEDLSSYIQPLLDRICESLPSPSPYDVVQMNGSCRAHKISLKAFLLLEDVEGAFGTALQSLKSVNLLFMDPPEGLSALSSRVSRQQDPVTWIRFFEYPLDLTDNTDVQDCITLLQAQKVSIDLRVHGSVNKEGNENKEDNNENEEEKDNNKSKEEEDIEDTWTRGQVDKDGWQALARAMQEKPNVVLHVEACKDWLAEVRREDTKAIWEAAGDFLVHHSEEEYMCDIRYCLCLAGRDWTTMEEILDMPKDEFMAKMDIENEDYWDYHL